MNALLLVWNLRDVVAKPFAHFSKDILMVLDSQEAALKPFSIVSNEISIVFESPGRCREAMIDGLDSPGGCCEAIWTLFQ